MRIFIHSVQLKGRGGLETVLKTLHPQLTKLGHEVYYLFPAPSDIYPYWVEALKPYVYYTQRSLFGIPNRFQNESTFFPTLILDLQETLLRLPKPDVIISISAFFIAMARIAIGVYKEPQPLLLSWIHESLHTIPPDQFPFFEYADGHLAISEGIRKQFQEIQPNKPAALIYNPIDLTNIHQVKRAEFPTFIYMARLDNTQKRIDVMFRAFAELPHKNFKIRIFGDITTERNDQTNQFMQLAKTLHINDQIEWMGWKENPWDFVAEATALVLSSDWEGFPNVLIEALARGIPVISTNCPTGPSEIIDHDHNGWLFNPGDSNGLKDILGKIIDREINVPSREICTKSVVKYRAEHVAGELINVLNHYLKYLK